MALNHLDALIRLIHIYLASLFQYFFYNPISHIFHFPCSIS